MTKDKKKAAKEELSKAKEEFKKTKDEWNKLSKNQKKYGIIGIVVIVLVITFYIRGTDGSDVVENESASNEVESVEAAEEEEADDFSGIKDQADSVELEDGHLTITEELTNVTSENAVLKRYVYNYFEFMEEAFSPDEVDSVEVVLEAVMVDEKGNESLDPVVELMYSRDDFEELNYENFLEMSYGQAWRVFNESTEYFIHPGVYNKVDAEYTNNLTYGKSKVQVVGD